MKNNNGPHTAERRNKDRLAVNMPVAYRTVDQVPNIAGQGTITDLSENGCCIRGTDTLGRGVRIELVVYDEEDETKPTVMRDCIVRWARTKQFGVQFLW
jgi:PilZ domain